MQFERDGARVSGCYDWSGGVLEGGTDGRVVEFEWREDGGTDVGTAVMVLSSSGKFLNGLWYRGGKLAGIWYGTRAPAGTKPRCTIGAHNAVSEALSRGGRAILYGILFDLDSAAIRAESEPTLRAVLTALRDAADLRLRIEGHTDSTDTDAHNLELSQRRAQAVVDWLVEHGVEAERLVASGYGESRPVADNATPQGRAQNRRVELASLD
jgi:outer membrane protein OmpA-like peptidoglycan-associated protein